MEYLAWYARQELADHRFCAYTKCSEKLIIISYPLKLTFVTTRVRIGG